MTDIIIVITKIIVTGDYCNQDNDQLSLKGRTYF